MKKKLFWTISAFIELYLLFFMIFLSNTSSLSDDMLFFVVFLIMFFPAIALWTNDSLFNGGIAFLNTSYGNSINQIAIPSIHERMVNDDLASKINQGRKW